MASAWRNLIGALSILLALNLASATSVRANPDSCQRIKMACRSAGFVIGGPPGDRLILDCFNPLVDGARPARASRPLPTIDPQWADACRAGDAGPQSPAGAMPPLGRAGVLTSGDGGQTVRDSGLNITWLADANLAATRTFGVSGVNSDGSMVYATAVRWVAAMNAYDHGRGYLGRHDWRLPATPTADPTCAKTGRHGESFGFDCSGGALGSLYYLSWRIAEPNTAVRTPENAVGPFNNFQPYLYWSGSAAQDPRQGFVTFSFGNGFQGANVKLNYLYVLPMIRGRAGAPQTVYDPGADVTWLADADLAARQTFGVSGVNADGAMDHATAEAWIEAMNRADHGRGYLGRTDWELPPTIAPDPSCSIAAASTTGFGCKASPMGTLFYGKLGLRAGDSVIAPSQAHVGPFYDVQPYLYWACAAESPRSPCQERGPADGFEWNFSFGNGFQGTNLVGNALFVMVYSPD